MNNIEKMTVKELSEIPFRNAYDEGVIFDSLIIIPGDEKDLHDSGYRCMDFVACKKQKPICRLSGCSDVMHLEGIGGFGRDWLEKYGKCPDDVPAVSWSMDCLPKSGLLRLFCSPKKMSWDSALSSFKIYSVDDK